jgi:hypothetical protein
MRQICLGDDHAGWLTIDGLSVAAPFRSAACFFAVSSKTMVEEEIEMLLSGSPAEISGGLNALEAVAQRAIQYESGTYANPQYLRLQQENEAEYWYTPITQIWFESGKKAYKTRQHGSTLIIMHYTRQNYFEGDEVLLMLTDKAGIDQTPTIDLKNHYDSGIGDSNTFLVKPSAFETDLPAPLRLQIENTYATGKIKDFLIGMYHHPSQDDDAFFYAQFDDLSGGSAVSDGSAIEGNYRTKTWTAAAFTELFSYSISAENAAKMDGRWYRPILHLFGAHTYDDLYLKISLLRGLVEIKIFDAIYCDPDYDYVLFPPMKLPPHRLMREKSPDGLAVRIEGGRRSAAAATLGVDQLLFLPLDASLTLLGFEEMDQDDTLIYDAARGLQNVRFTSSEYEAVSHISRGGPLTLFPGAYNRVILVISNENNQVDIDRTVKVKATYRPRVRFV